MNGEKSQDDVIKQQSAAREILGSVLQADVEVIKRFQGEAIELEDLLHRFYEVVRKDILDSYWTSELRSSIKEVEARLWIRPEC